MENELKPSILTKPINDLWVTDEFKLMATENGFETIKELLSFSLTSLMRKPKFSMHVLDEFYKLLEKEGCVELLS